MIESLIKGGVVTRQEKPLIRKASNVSNPQELQIDIAKIEQAIASYTSDSLQSTESAQWTKSLIPQDVLDDPAILESQKALTPEEIVAEEEDFMVVYKPQGVLSHPASKGEKDSVLYRAMAYLYKKGHFQEVSAIPRAGLLHRLDRDTSGLLLIAKNRRAYAELHQKFTTRKITKFYWAVAQMADPHNSRLLAELDPVNMPLKWPKVLQKQAGYEVWGSIRPARGRRGSMVFNFHKQGKVAGSTFWLLSRQNDLVLLAVKLHTGRTHQIRAQLKHFNVPIVGDTRYNSLERPHDTAPGSLFTPVAGLNLFAVRLEFTYGQKKYEFDITEKISRLLSFRGL